MNGILAPRPTPPQGHRAPWAIRNAAEDNVPVIELFGDIGVSTEGDPWWGMEGGAGTFQEFAKALRDLGPVSNLRVEIHSYGGSVVVGKAMHDKLREHPAKKTAVIYGICASAATYPALACDIVEIPANSFFLIHNTTVFAWGDSKEMHRAANEAEISDQSIANLYATRTGLSVEAIRAKMDEDTWMTGTDAVAMGLADKVIEPVAVPDTKRADPENFRRSAIDKMPDAARAWLDATNRTALSLVAPDMVNRATKPPENDEMTTSTPDAGTTAVTTPAAAAPATSAAPAAATTVTATENTTKPVDVDGQVKNAIAAERSRVANITAMCNRAGCPNLAQKWIDDGAAVSDVQNALFDRLCTERPALNEGAGTGGVEGKPKTDEDKLREEYRRDEAVHNSLGVTEDEYVKSRQIDKGLNFHGVK